MNDERFARSRYTARLWWGPVQVQAWRGGAWVVGWNGRRWYATVGGDPVYGWAVDLLDGGWRSVTLSLVPMHRRWRNGLAVTLQRDPIR